MDEELHRAVGRLEGKVDTLLMQGSERTARLASLETQMTDVRQVQARGHGMTAAIGAAAGVVMWVIGLLWDKIVTSS
jgi:hypothetical protein